MAEAFGHPDRIALISVKSLEMVKVLVLFRIQCSEDVCIMFEPLNDLKYREGWD